MATRRALTRVLGRTRQLPAGDVLNGVYPPYTPAFKASGAMLPIYRRDGVEQGVAAHIPVYQANGAELRVATDVNFAVVVTQTAGTTRLVNAGVAGVTQKIPVQFANLGSFPAIGSSERLYIAVDTRFEYLWTGNGYALANTLVTSALGSTDDLPEGLTNLYFTAARVLSTVLTGLSLTTNAAITAADTVLVALGKLQSQINNKLDVDGNGSQLSSLNASELSSGTVPSARLSGSYGINITGNAATATSATTAGSATTATTATQANKLTTARTINGVAFDGTANITLPSSGGVFTVSYVSALVSIAIGAASSFSHGLGVAPKLFFGRLVCVADEYGYVFGEEVDISSSTRNRDTSNTGSELGTYNYGFGVSATATILAVKFPGGTGQTADSLVYVVDKSGTTNSLVPITAANWRVRLYAYA